MKKQDLNKQYLNKLIADFMVPSTPGGVIMGVGFGGPMFEEHTLDEWIEAINTLKADKEFEMIALASAVPAEEGPEKAFFINDEPDGETPEINIELIQRFPQYAVRFNTILTASPIGLLTQQCNKLDQPIFKLTDEQIVEQFKLLGVDVVVSNFDDDQKCIYTNMGSYFIN